MAINIKNIIFRSMKDADFDEVSALWQQTENIGLSNADTRENISNFLVRNPGLSFVALINNNIIGTILCGHDGRRGCIYHLAVNKTHRKYGIGRQLVQNSLDGLAKANIERCHIHVYVKNKSGLDFWGNSGWFTRDELELLSINIHTLD
jgi:ribosomal protein S18 acetylase RimI-like enzyme